MINIADDVANLADDVIGATSKKAGKRFTPDQQALMELVKEYKRNGVTTEDAKTLLKWAKEYDLKPFLDHMENLKDHYKFGSHIRIGPEHHLHVIDYIMKKGG